jgi:osmotically-inducible protein OsmY
MQLLNRVATAFFLIAVLAAASACASGPNPTDNVTKALRAANLNEVTVDWDRGAHIAHLKGTVDRSADRQRAEEVASAAVGQDGRVLNEITIKGLNEKTAGNLDGQIKDQLKDMVKSDPILRDRDLSFEVNNGVVTVKGDVQTADEKTKVTELVRAAPGVKDMANAVEIKPKTP